MIYQKVILITDLSYDLVGWLVGCLGFNGSLKRYFCLYRAVS